MLIFNTTFHLDNSVHEACLKFFKEEYIPKAISNGLLTLPSMARVHPQHEETGVTYAIQFKAHNMADLNLWAAEIGEDLTKELVRKFGDKVAGFPTLLDEITL